MALLLAFPTMSHAATASVDVVETDGPITAIGEASVTVAAFTFAVTEDTVIEDAEGEPLTLADLTVGTVVEIEGHEAEGGLVADSVGVLDAGDGDGDGDGDGGSQEIEIEGVIDALDGTSVTVSGLIFAVTEGTEIEGEDDEILTLADLAIGMVVEIEGTVEVGAFFATSIKVEESDEEGDEVEAEGPITALGDATLTVDGVTFAVTEETEIEAGDEALTFADLSLGMIVEVEGEFGAEGPIADKVKVEHAEGDESGEEEVEVTGSIEAIGEASLTVAGLTFVVTADTEIEGLDDEPLTLVDLVVGEIVEAEGHLDESGVLVATKIEREDGISLNGIVAVTAAVDHVAQGSLVLIGRVFDVRPPTEIVDAAGEPVELSSLASGDVVTVQARLAGNGHRLMALRIQASDASADAVTATGPLSEVEADTLTVIGAAFVVDAGTAYFDAEGNEATIDALIVGRTVEVVAGAQADGVRLAASVRLVSAFEGEGDLAAGSGNRGSASSGTFTLPGMTVTFDESTLIRDAYDNVLDASALVSGSRVKVVGETSPTGGLRSKSGASSTEEVSADRIVVYNSTTTSTEPGATPSTAVVAQAYPNPTTGTVRVAFDLDTDAEIGVAVYDVLGREVVRVQPEAVPAGGDRTVVLDLTGLSAGVYVYRVDVRTAGTTHAATGRISVVR